MEQPNYTLQQYGAAPSRELLLSLGIPTWRRERQLDLFLQRLTPILRASRYRDQVEVVISNNASPDNTAEVVRNWVRELDGQCRVRVFTHHENIGGEPNFRFIYEHAEGAYVWSCSDHDIIHASEFDTLVEDLQRHRPQVCISSFVNYGTTKDQIKLEGDARTRVVTELPEAVRCAYEFGKLTQYALRREHLSAADQAFSEEASRGRVWFSAMAVMLFHRHEPKLLLRRGAIGHSERDGLNLMFSARVYGEVREYVAAGLMDHPHRAEITALLPATNVMIPVVGHLFWNALGTRKMKLECARSDFDFVRAHLWEATFASWRNTLKMPVVLALFPLTYRRRLAREK